ncbi:MAG: hypothetical protein ACHRHE_18415 [Tepidisphaerales bacterium]
MFAVMILGIGFIMIAAMFPVAIQQTQVTQEESAAAGVAQMAMQYMQRAPTSSTDTPPLTLYPFYNDQWQWPSATPPAERIQPLRITLLPGSGLQPLAAWDILCGGMIFKQDPRYAWVPLYRRAQNNNYAQVVFFIVQARATDSFTPADVAPNGSNQNDPNSYPRLFPRRVLINTVDCGSTYVPPVPDTIQFDSSVDPNMLAPGEFVVIGRTGGGIAGSLTDMPTRIYRLGNQRLDLDPSGRAYELAPGFGTSSTSEKALNVEGWMMGRQKDANGVYQGPAMDIGCYSSFIMLK